MKSIIYIMLTTLLCTIYAYVMASIVSIAVNDFMTALFYEAIK